MIRMAVVAIAVGPGSMTPALIGWGQYGDLAASPHYLHDKCYRDRRVIWTLNSSKLQGHYSAPQARGRLAKYWYNLQ